MPNNNYDAILIVSFGGPEQRDDVIPFLENVLRGKPVPRERMLEVAEHYYHFDGISPINGQVRDFIAALRPELDRAGINLPIYWGNRNWNPLLPDTMRQMAADGVQRVLAVFTSAYSSYSGCRQYRENVIAARELVGWKHVKLDAQCRTVELLKPGMQLDFGGIAKGYIAQQVRDLLVRRGQNRCLIAVAGDIVAGDPPLDADGRETAGWKIGVAPLDKPNGPPSRMLRLKNCSVSTSGDAFQFVEIGGVRYSHIVDPKTGLGLTQRSSVTIIAPDGANADGLATAVTILGVERGLKLIEQSQNAASTHRTAALIVFAGSDGLTVSESPHFKAFVIDN